MQIRILQEHPDDIAKFRELRLDQLRYDGEDSYFTYDEWKDKPTSAFEQYLRQHFFCNPQYNFLAVVEEQDALIGMVGIQRMLYNQQHILYMKNMYVRPDQRGRGYGRMLMDFLFAHLNTQNITKINLEVLHHNVIARGLYEKYGFEEVGKRRHNVYYNGKYYDVHLMEKYL